MYKKTTKEEIIYNFKKKLRERSNDGYLEHYGDYILNVLFDKNNNNLFDLTERELNVIRERNGINESMTVKTLQEIADELGRSRARTRDIELKAYRKIFDELEYLEETYCLGEFQLSEDTAKYIINNEEISNFKDYYTLLFSKDNSLEIEKLKEDFTNHFKKKGKDITACPLKLLGLEEIILKRLYDHKIFTINDLISKPKVQVSNIFGSAKSSFFFVIDRLQEIGYDFLQIA